MGAAKTVAVPAQMKTNDARRKGMTGDYDYLGGLMRIKYALTASDRVPKWAKSAAIL